MITATECVDSIQRAIDTIPLLIGKTFSVYSEDDLADRTKMLSLPCAGVIYDGMKSFNDAGDTGKMGMSAEAVVTVLVLFKQNTTASNDPKSTIIALMDDMRVSIMGTRSPSNHFWRFVLEIPVEGKKGVLGYIQRWSTPVLLTTTKK